MKSLFSAHQAYKQRLIQAALDTTPGNVLKRFVPRESLLVQFGDLLIHTGLKLKRSRVSRKSIAWSPTTGVKP